MAATEGRNVHVTLPRVDAEALSERSVTEETVGRVRAAIGEAERLEQATESARRLDEEGKLTPVDLELGAVAEGCRKDHLRVIWREPDGEELRCSIFLPLPPDMGEAFVAGMSAAYPAFTAYTYNEAERMVRASQQNYQGSLNEALESIEAISTQLSPIKTARTKRNIDMAYEMVERLRVFLRNLANPSEAS